MSKTQGGKSMLSILLCLLLNYKKLLHFIDAFKNSEFRLQCCCYVKEDKERIPKLTLRFLLPRGSCFLHFLFFFISFLTNQYVPKVDLALFFQCIFLFFKVLSSLFSFYIQNVLTDIPHTCA